MTLKTEELFSKLNLLETLALGKLESIFDSWIPLDNLGEVDHVSVCALFAGWAKGLNKAYALDGAGDESAWPMPILQQTKPAEGWAEHGCVRTFGSVNLYGGSARKFDETAFLSGPIYVGESCAIRISAKVVGPVLVGDDVVLNSSSVFTRSIIQDGSEVGVAAQVTDSLIGRGVHIRNGVIICNESHPTMRRPIVTQDLRHESCPAVKTGRTRLGAIIGDDCLIGAGAILEPGVVLLPGCEVPTGRILKAGIYNQEVLDHGVRSEKAKIWAAKYGNSIPSLRSQDRSNGSE